MMKKKVLLFLAEGFEAYEASVFTDVFGWSREAGTIPVELSTTGFKNTIHCYWNLIVQPEIHFNDVKIEDYDALAIPGGAEGAGFFKDAFDQRLLDLICKFNEQNKPIASICVAAVALAKSGILKNRKATTWDLNNGSRRQELEQYGAIVLDQPIVIDDNIITSTGPATSLDVAFALLEKLTTKENVDVVKENMRIGTI